jgi:hypothetical protein
MSVEERKATQIVAALLGVAAVVFVLANTHLIYIAISTEPDCVGHAKTPGEGIYRAAKSAC